MQSFTSLTSKHVVHTFSDGEFWDTSVDGIKGMRHVRWDYVWSLTLLGVPAASSSGHVSHDEGLPVRAIEAESVLVLGLPPASVAGTRGGGAPVVSWQFVEDHKVDVSSTNLSPYEALKDNPYCPMAKWIEVLFIFIRLNLLLLLVCILQHAGMRTIWLLLKSPCIISSFLPIFTDCLKVNDVL